jgi:hypothetical protein
LRYRERGEAKAEEDGEENGHRLAR